MEQFLSYLRRVLYTYLLAARSDENVFNISTTRGKNENTDHRVTAPGVRGFQMTGVYS